MDIAVDRRYVATRTYLAARRGAWIMPEVPPRPARRPLRTILASPASASSADASRRCCCAAGRRHDGGLRPAQARPPLRRGAPDVSGRILDRLAHGAITPKPNIARLHERRGRVRRRHARAEADLVVYCTGYKITLPVLRRGRSSRRPTTTSSCSGASSTPTTPTWPSSALLQPLGAIMPLAEAPGPVDRRPTCAGEYHLPARPEMLRATSAADQAAMRKRYVASKRHTIQVDFDDYLLDLDKERAAGAERARAAGFALPVRRRGGARRARGRRGRVSVDRRRRPASASRPRRPTARRSSTPRARSSPTSATARRRVRDIVRRTDLASGHLLQLLPGQGVGAPRARRRDRRRGAGARRAPRGRTRPPSRPSSPTASAPTSPSSPRTRRRFD